MRAVKLACIFFIWTLCGVITYGVIRHISPEDVEGDEVLCMYLCFCIWPFFLVLAFGLYVFRRLSKIGDFVGGFIDSITRKDDKSD